MCSSPLRRDRTPSFAIYEEEDRWYDFGTSEGGDVFAFVMQRDGCGFREAVDTLATRAGVERWDERQADPVTRAALNDLLERRWVAELISEAADYYARQLPDAMRVHTRETWGFTYERIEASRIGWADGGLFAYMHHDLGHHPDKLIKTGLFVRTRDGLKDFFLRRLVVPYYFRGLAHYMIGRRVEGHTDDTDWERGKYKKQLTHNSRHDYVSKHVAHVLYGLDSVRGRRDLLVITEGITDAITAHDAGFACISPVTVAFRDEDIPRLVEAARGFRRVVIFNDLGEVNNAGKKGALKTAAALFREGIDVRIVDLRSLGMSSASEKVDLNSYTREHGTEALHTAIERALRYPEFLIEQIPSSCAPGELGDRLGEVYEVVGTCNEIEREAYVERISARFRIGRRVVRNGLRAHVVDADESDAGEVRELFYGEVQEDERSFYFVRQGDQSIRVSNFVGTVIERMVEDDGGERLSVWFDTVEGKRIGPHVLSRRALRCSNDLVAELDPYPDLLWSGTNANVTSVRGILSRVEVPRVRAVPVVGRVAHDGSERFVWPGGALGPDGLDDSGSLRWLGEDDPLCRSLRLDVGEDAWSEEEIAALAGRVMPLLFKLNDPEVMCPALGWIYACIDAPGLRKALGHFALLWLWATQGSGKSTLVALLGQLVGLTGSPSSAGDTPFAMIRALSASNCVPIPYDEYKGDMPVHERRRFERFARRVYSGELETRGRADQTVTSYKLERPMMICGELAPNDPALLERVLIASPLKSGLTEERQETLARLASEPLWRLAGAWYRFALARPLAPDLAAARNILGTLEREAGLTGEIGIRARDALLTMIVGLVRCEAWCEGYGVPLPDVLDAEVFTRIVAASSGTDDDDDDVRSLRPGHRLTALDMLLRAARDMAAGGFIEEGTHYAMVNGELCLHLGLVYGAYLERQRARGLHDETNGLRALRRAAREQSIGGGGRGGYVNSRSKLVQLGSNRLRCLAVDMGKLCDATGVEPFPVRQTRGWGGTRPDDAWSDDD